MATEADEMANPQSNGAVIYAAIANWRTKSMVCEYVSKAATSESHTSEIIAESILPLLTAPTDAPASASQYQDYRIYYTSYDDDSALIHMCTKDYKVQYSLGFQEEVHGLWAQSGESADSGRAPGFRATLQEQVDRYTNNPPKSKFDRVQDKQNEIKEVLIQNIEAVVKRHGQIEITLDGTESLKETSRQFSQSSRKVKQTAQCQLYKSYALFACVVIVLIGVIILIICVTAKC